MGWEMGGVHTTVRPCTSVAVVAIVRAGIDVGVVERSVIEKING